MEKSDHDGIDERRAPRSVIGRDRYHVLHCKVVRGIGERSLIPVKFPFAFLESLEVLLAIKSRAYGS